MLIGLGVWQLSRFQYKQRLQVDLDTRIAAPQLELGAGAAPPDDLDYHRVALEGRWDIEHALTITSRVRYDTQGEEVVVPLLPADGGPAVLVNRGWYPLSERERVRAQLAQPQAGRVEGLARQSQGGTARRSGSGAWTTFDVQAMGGTLPYAVASFGVVEGPRLAEEQTTPPPTLPVQGYSGFRNTTPHLEYALTWFALAAVLAVTAYLRLFRRARTHARAAAGV